MTKLIDKGLVAVFFIPFLLNAQAIWDTTKYEKLNDRFIVAYFQSVKSFNSEIGQVTLKDSLNQSSFNYFAETNTSQGVELNFDKINLQIGFKSRSPKATDKYGQTDFFNLGFNFGGNRWFIESSYRRYTGFYDRNTPNYDTSFKRTGQYTLQPNMNAILAKVKFLYFTNSKKYSFRSGYACNYRQLKSAASWVLSGNIYNNQQTNDSSFIPLIGRKYYRHFADLNSIRVTGFSANAGFTFNLVLFKAWFFNLLATIGPEQQWRKYGLINQGSGTTYSFLSLSGDVRSSMGLNLKRFYLLYSFTIDYTAYNNYIIEYNSRYISNNFTFGWRFKAKTPAFYKKFQQTKFYKKL